MSNTNDQNSSENNEVNNQDPTIAAGWTPPPNQPAPQQPQWNPNPNQAPQQQWNPNPNQAMTQQVPIQNSVENTSKKDNKWLMRGALIAAVFTLLAGFGLALNYTVFDKDGESTPEAAAEALFESLEQEDPLGVVEVMLPSEFESTVKPTNSIIKELVRLNYLTDEALNNGNVSLGDSLKIEVIEPLVYESEALVEGYEEIQVINIIGGELEITADTSQLKKLIGDRSEIDKSEMDDQTETTIVKFEEGSYITEIKSSEPDSSKDLNSFIVGDEDPPGVNSSDRTEEPFSLVAVKEDGGYHISVAYSIAEAIRKDAGEPKPDFNNRLQAQGADSPEEALTLLMKRISDSELDEAMATMDPQEFKVLYDYWSLFGEDIEDADFKQSANNEGVDWDLEFAARSEKRDGRTVAIPTGLSGTIKIDQNFADGTQGEAQFELNENSFSANGTFTDSNSRGTFDIKIVEENKTLKGTAKVSDGIDDFDATFEINTDTLSGSGTLKVEDETITADFVFENNCFVATYTIEGDTETVRECQGAESFELWTEYQDLIERVFEDLETPGFTVVERDGKWYVSGSPTYLYTVSDVLKALTEEEIDELSDFQDDFLDQGDLLNNNPFILGPASDNFEVIEPSESDIFGNDF